MATMMLANDVRLALGAIKSRSGTPFEMVDRDGRTVRLMHIDGDRFELRMRGGRLVEYAGTEVADMLFFMEGQLRFEPLKDAVGYVLETA